MSNWMFSLILAVLIALSITIGYRAKGLIDQQKAEATYEEVIYREQTTIPLRGW